MGLALEFFRFNRAGLLRRVALIAAALFLGVSVKADFRLDFMAAAIPASICIATTIVYFGYLWVWQGMVAKHAREMGIPYSEYVMSEKYRTFLHEKSPALIKIDW
jgi:hypothetical protein